MFEVHNVGWGEDSCIGTYQSLDDAQIRASMWLYDYRESAKIILPASITIDVNEVIFHGSAPLGEWQFSATRAVYRFILDHESNWIRRFVPSINGWKLDDERGPASCTDGEIVVERERTTEE